MQELLESLGLITSENVELLATRTRDKENCHVFYDTVTGIIFLKNDTKVRSDDYNESRSNTMSETHSRVSFNNNEYVLPRSSVSERRTLEFGKYLKDKIWLDIGSGDGSIFNVLKNRVKKCVSVEINDEHRNDIIKCGIECYKYIDQLPDDYFEVITLFHVFEHFDDPLDKLNLINKKLKTNGLLILEVPHANDALISIYKHQPFINFTLRSDHLILHTHKSLRKMLESVGMSGIRVESIQRYNLANHLYWLQKGLPGGHTYFKELMTKELNEAYAQALIASDATDTIVSFSHKK